MKFASVVFVELVEPTSIAVESKAAVVLVILLSSSVEGGDDANDEDDGSNEDGAGVDVVRFEAGSVGVKL